MRHRVNKAETLVKGMAESIDAVVANASVQKFLQGGRKFGDREHPSLHKGFEQIVESIFAIDVEAEYARLKRELRVQGEGFRHRDTLLAALDSAEENARIARDIAVTARVERETWKVKQEAILAGIRSRALIDLQKEKEAGLRNKQITDADVESRMAELFPDEYTYAREREAKVKGMAESLDTLANLWEHRCSSLQSMLGGNRRLS